MNWQDIAFVSAGLVGAFTSVVHGVLMQRFMVRPFEAALVAQGHTSAPLLRLLPVLLHLSTFAWLLGGAALVLAGISDDVSVRRTTAAGVGALYLFGVVGNFWATRGRHPGWMLLSLSLGLIVAGVT